MSDPFVGTDVFADEVDVAPTRSRVWVVVGSLVAVGLVFGGIAAFLLTGGTAIGQVLLPALLGPAAPSVATVEAGSGVELPDGAVVQPPVDDNVYVVGQVAFSGSYEELLATAGYIEVADIPAHANQQWDGRLEEPRYFVTGDGRSALAGTVDGASTVTFYAAP